MKIKVTNIISNSSNCIVSCTTEFGDIILTWKDDIPEVDKQYDVEFDTDEILNWDDDISLTEVREPEMYAENDGIVINATLESVDDDGFMVVRMKDYILTFETQGKALHNGAKVRIKIHSLEAYPVSYN